MVAPLLDLLLGPRARLGPGAVRRRDLTGACAWLTRLRRRPARRARCATCRSATGTATGSAALRLWGDVFPALLVASSAPAVYPAWPRRARSDPRARPPSCDAARPRDPARAIWSTSPPDGSRDLRVRLPELRQRPPGARRRPARQRPGLGAVLVRCCSPGAGERQLRLGGEVGERAARLSRAATNSAVSLVPAQQESSLPRFGRAHAVALVRAEEERALTSLLVGD